MKKTIQSILTLLFFFSLAQSGYAQEQPMYQRNNDGSWTLGINAGTAWQQGDIKATPGWGVGLTLGKNIWHRPGGFFDVDLRGRLLYTQTYGKDSRRDNSLLLNPVYNGTFGEELNYSDDPGYLFQNHRSGIGELSIEGVLTANKLREKTGVIFSIFGGVGVDLYKTKADQLDLLGSAYDYTLIDSSANRGRVIRELNAMRDGEYETLADGFNNGTRVSIMPSWGVGLGYQVTPTFSVGMEHKVTYALNDLLEGQRYASNSTLTPNNDKYHYTSLYLRWKIFGNNRDSGDPISEGPGVIEPGLPDPVVTITKPRDRSETRDSRAAILATIENVSQKKDIELKVNGTKVYDFTFNDRTNKFATVVPLIPGYNEIEITAYNSVGTDKDQVSVIYKPTIPVGPVNPTNPQYPNNTVRPPVVQIVNPSSNPANTQNANGKVQATIRYIQNRNGITYTLNGYRNNDFNFDPNSNSFVSNPTWKPGKNEVVITAINIDGSDSDSRTIHYQVSQQGPNVTIVQPSPDPYTTETTTVNVKATVTGVNSRNEINYSINGNYSNNFNFNLSTGVFTSTLSNLSTGTTNVQITASNNTGADSDDISIVYCPPSYGPSVSITKPSKDPSETTSSSTQILASVYGIDSRDRITFKVNGIKTNNFSYNGSNQSFSATVNLQPGNNSISITAANNVGSDSDSRTIVYTQPAVKPVVTITKPTNNPHTANEKVEFVEATIQNVIGRNDVTLTVNGASTNSFSFNSNNGFFSAEIPLQTGANNVVITGVNSAGSASDNVTIMYSEPIPAPTVTITTPQPNPYNTQSVSVVIKARVTNVPGNNGIDFRWNGSRITGYSYNASTGLLEGTVKARTGKNSVVINVRNDGGSDSDNKTVIYTAPTPKPIVNITLPSADPSFTENKKAVIKATIRNITSSREISFKVNGKLSKEFTFNASFDEFRAPVTLVPGKNTIQITATNAGGTASDSRTINYAEPGPVLNPVSNPEVTIIRPSKDKEVSPSASYKVQARITGLTGASTDKVTFKVNGRINKNFSFNHATTQFASTISLNVGNNFVEITAQNEAGSDTDSKTIIYNCPDPDPVFNFRNPMSSPLTVSEKDFRMSLFVHNAKKENITVRHNGKVKSFSFNAGAKFLECVLVLAPGQNTMTVTATNPCGSNTETVIVNYDVPNTNKRPSTKPSSPVLGGKTNLPNTTTTSTPTSEKTTTRPTTSGKKGNVNTVTGKVKPEVTLISPATSSKLMTVKTATASVKAKVDHVAGKPNIRLLVNGKPVNSFSYNADSKEFAASVNLKAGSTTKIEIIAINSKGTTRKTMNLNLK